ncbi:PaaI family thioesterase [Paroceanicella profunda]|uniref:PaaI family thioesterase n=1 Tax=Paroceanicella profunda TaxID=2579971 RepID=A0A5B8FHC2_9RHOB|nr:PaaI family thioesterase [Paroceanicella profunda]QDL92261.1 PaaI family thioesterase [Paroceanicella profunda]
MTAFDLEARIGLARAFIGSLPHAQALGLEFVSMGLAEAVLRVPYHPRLVGDPETGVMHGGVITTLLDTCSGTAVMLHPTNAQITATMDLRIDYMRAAAPGLAVSARALCYHTTRNVGFVRATAFEGADETAVVATASGAFIIDRDPREETS